MIKTGTTVKIKYRGAYVVGKVVRAINDHVFVVDTGRESIIATDKEMTNPLTNDEKEKLFDWSNTQHIISNKYLGNDPVRSEFYHGRFIAARKIIKMFNPTYYQIEKESPNHVSQMLAWKWTNRAKVIKNARQLALLLSPGWTVRVWDRSDNKIIWDSEHIRRTGDKYE
jgi:hypothetical protein